MSAGLLALSVAVAGGVLGARAVLRAGRGRRRPRGRGVAPERFLPVMPGGVLVAYAVQRQFLLPRSDRVEWFLGGDHVRHLIFVVDERASGNLTYARETYPRAWHTLVTALWSASGAQLHTASGLVSLVDLMSTAVWLLYALLVVVTGQLASTLAWRVGLSARGAGLAGLVAGSLSLTPSFLANYQGLGFETSILGAVLLAVVARELVERPSNPIALLVCAACTAVMANTWQLLLPATAAGFAFCAVALVGRVGRGGLVWVVAASGAMIAISVPGILAVVTSVGIGHATDAGVVAPLPVVLLPLGCLALVGMIGRWPRDRTLWGFAVVAGLPALTGLAVAAKVGIPPTQYYPSKLMWHTAVLCLAPIGVLAAYAEQTVRARESRPAAAGRILVAVVLALGVAYAFVSPLAAQLHKWSTVHGKPVLAALTTPEAGSAQVVWLSGGRADSTITRILLDYYRADRTHQRTPQPPLSIEGECRLLEASTAPTVLSDEPEAAVSARYACASRVRTVAVLGSR